MLGRSIQLGRIFGIRIGANPSWFVVLFLLIWLLTGQYKDAFPGHDTKAFGLAVASALLLFLCILLHELGHALVARRNNVPIAGIELWLFGGIATMTREPDTPGAAFRIAAAARGTEIQTRMPSQLEGLSVADVMDAEPVAVPSEAHLDRVLDEFFLRYRWPWFPVIDRAGRFLGLVIRESVDQVPEALRSDQTVDQVMAKDAEG